MAKLNNTKKSGKNVADDKERLASEIAARYDPNSATYKYRDKTPYQSLREKNEISTIPRTYESQRYSRSTPEGSAYRQNQSPALTTEDYRNAANAYIANRQQSYVPKLARNYNPNWRPQMNGSVEEAPQPRIYPEIKVDKNSAGYKKYGDKWTRALTLSAVSELNKDEKREAAEILKQLQSDYNVVDQTDVFFSPDMPSDMWKTYIDLYNKSNAGTGITAGFMDAFGAPGLLDKGSELASGMLGEEYTPGSVKEQFSRIGSAHPNAYSAGNVAGSLASMLAAGEAVGAGLGTISGFGKLPKLLQGAIRSGATMGLSEAVSAAANMPTKREWDISEANKKEFLASFPDGGIDYTPKDYSFWGQAGDVLRKTGIRTVGGFAGGLAGGAVGELGKAVLVKHGLQTPFAEVMRQAVSGTAFSAADIGSTYFLLPKEERPNPTEMAQQVATAFLFSVLEGSISTISTTMQNKAKLENAVAQMQSEYSSMLEGKSPEEQIAALRNITELNKNIRSSISQNYYAGQQDAINDILQTLDAVDEAISLIQRGITSGSSGSTPANATSPVPTSPSPAGNYPAPIGNSTAPTNSSEAAKQALAQAAARASQAQPPEDIRQAASQAAENAAQSAIKPETKNNTTPTTKEPTTGVATNETAAQPEASQETDKAKTAATALDNITKAGAMNTPYEAVTDAYKEMVSTGVITPRELSDAYATGLAEYNKSHADTTGDNEYATKIANALSTLNKYVDNDIKYTIRGNDNWGYTAAVTRIRDNNGGVPIENARDTLFIMSGLKTRQDAVDALVGVSQNLVPVGTTQETVSPAEAPKVERKPPNDAMIQKLEEAGFKRWTKGAHDRLYINATSLGLEYETYKSGSIRSATFNGEEISNSRAGRMLAMKMYIDVTTGELHTTNGKGVQVDADLAAAAEALYNSIIQGEEGSQALQGNDVDAIMTSEEQGAIRQYKSGSTSYVLNEKMYSGAELSESEKALADKLDKALNKLPNYKGITYRVLSFDRQGKEAYDAFISRHVPGKIVSYGAYTSASKTQGAYDVDGTLKVRIEIDGKTGKDISHGFGLSAEDEVVYGRKTKYIVNSVVKGQDGVTIIKIKEVGTNDESILPIREESVDGSAKSQNPPVRNVQEMGRIERAGQAGVRSVPERDTQSGIRRGSGSLQGELSRGQRDVGDTGRRIEKQATVINPQDALATTIADKLIKKGTAFNSSLLFELADKAYGGTMADGTYTVKDAYDAMELAVNKTLLSVAKNFNGDVKTAVRAVNKLQSILDKLPTQTKRTEEQTSFQQFSTPPNIAFLAAWAANINDSDVVLEPSAGIGGLAVFPKAWGADVVVNELSERRLAFLKNMGFDRVFNENAEQINNVLPDDVKPSIVIMNPPFSSTAGRTATNKTSNAIRHVEQALQRLEDGGRLVAILGRGMANDTASFKSWWDSLRQEYDVRANISIDGSNYKKYGTSFDVQLAIIDKTGPQKGETITGTYKNLTEIPEVLEGIRNDRIAVAGSLESGNGRGIVGLHESESNNERNRGIRSGHDGKPANTELSSMADRTGDTVSSVTGQRAGVQKDNSRSIQPSTGSIDGRGIGNSTSGISAGMHDGTKGDGERPNTVGHERTPANGVKRKKTKSDNGVYADYEPAKLPIKGAKPHPTKLVESSAMASVPAPVATYMPNLPQELITSGALSSAQLENIVYAGQAHQQTLPDGSRKGYFIGDGTGVGKGREIAGIILDNFRQGRNKAVWVSVNPNMVIDATRDWTGLGQNKDDIMSLSKVKLGKSIAADSGILFASYNTLASSEGETSRLQQIVDWLGKDFDGVIAFDEAHKMNNLMGKQGARGKTAGSQMAKAGVELQRMLPNARVVYVSATGATDVSGLAFAERLGLWGRGTAFNDAKDFVSKIGSSGIAAMELVSRDMKASGVYLARSISYDGVTYDTLQHTLTPTQTKIYNTMSKAWQITLQNVQAALKETGASKAKGNAKSSAVSQYYSAIQRFYNQVLTSMSMPSVIDSMKKELAAGHSCVLQLVNTNEAEQERQVAKIKDTNGSLDDLDITPRGVLIGYLENSFPVQVYEDYTDENGNTYSRPVHDSQGNPVLDKKAIAMRDALIEQINEMSVPDGPLDMLFDAFGSDAVAEVSGRKRRIVSKTNENGETVRVEERRSAHANDAEIQAFQDGKKRILVFSGAGNTGKSYHSDLNAKNQQQRIHYLLQPGWNASEATQGFGRTHRSNQANTPKFVLVTTNVSGQKRFVSTIARRLDQLGALTKGQRETGAGMFSDRDNLETQLARDSLRMFYERLGKGLIDGIDGMSILEKLGLKKDFVDEFGNFKVKSEDTARDMGRFLNRILALEVDEQNRVFDEFYSLYEEQYDKALKDGTLDRGLENVKADRVEILDDKVVRTDKSTGATTNYVQAKTYTKSAVLRDVNKLASLRQGFQGLYKTDKGSVVAVYKIADKTNERGEVKRMFRAQSPVAGKFGTWNETTLNEHTKKLEKSEWKTEWASEVAKAPEYDENTVHMLTGALLPIWDILPQEGNTRAMRITAEDGSQYLGRVIPANQIDGVLSRLGAGKRTLETFDTRDVMQRVMNGDTVKLSGEHQKIQRSRVSNEYRIEITGKNLWALPTNYPGIFVETINWQKRYFIPTGEKGVAILESIVKDNPISEIKAESNDFDLMAVGESSDAVSWWNANRVGDRDKKSMPISDIINKMRHDFGIPIGKGRMPRKDARGRYSKHDFSIRTRVTNDLPAISHELGHHLDNVYELTQHISKDLENELIKQLPAEFHEKYAASKLKGEGLAEFVRRYLQNKDLAAIDYPLFIAHFENTLSADALSLVNSFADEINAYYSLDEGTAVSSIRNMSDRPRDFRTTKERTSQKASEYYQKWVDEFHGIELFDRAAGSNAHMSAINSAYSDAIAYSVLTGDLTDANGSKRGEGLGDILSSINMKDKTEWAEFGEYLVVRHGPERLSEGMRIFADDRKNSAFWMQQRQSELETMHPEFADAAERLDAFQRNVLQAWGVETGLVSEKSAHKWAERWKYYVPLNRAIDKQNANGAKRGFANQTSTIRKARGSGADIIHPVDNIINNTVKMINAGIRNGVMLDIRNAALRTEGLGSFIEKAPTPTKIERFNTFELKETLVDAFMDAGFTEADTNTALNVVANIDDFLLQFKHGVKPNGNMITVLVDGNPEYWKVNDPMLLESLTSMSRGKTSEIVEWYGAISRLMTSNITGLNLIWSIGSNTVRDLGTLVTYSKDKNIVHLISGLIKAYTNSFKAPNKQDPMYKEFLAVGGGSESAYTADRDMTKNIRAKLSGSKQMWLNPIQWIEALSNVIERGPRYATYKMMRDAGMTPQEAIYESHNITVNFRRGGSISRQVNKVVPFFNASVQGADRLISWLGCKDIPKAERTKAIRNRVGWYVAAYGMLGLLQWFINSRDDEDEKYYAQLSNYTKNNFWCIPIYENGKHTGEYITIPKPRELAVPATVISNLMELVASGNKRAFGEFDEYVLDSYLPNVADDTAKGIVGFIHGDAGFEDMTADLLGNLGVIGIAAYAMANRDFLGKPIESAYYQNLEKRDRYNDRTSKLAYLIGQAFNESPIMVDYVGQQLFGGFWKTQKALLPMNPDKADYTLGLSNTYRRDSQYSTDLINDMYDIKAKAMLAHNSDKDNMEKAIAYKEAGSMAAFYSNYNKLEGSSDKATRQIVLDMIDEFVWAMQYGERSEIQKRLDKLCTEMGDTSYMCSALNPYVKDDDGNRHNLTAAQYVEYQGLFNGAYWQYVGKALMSSDSTQAKAIAVNQARARARSEADGIMLSRLGVDSKYSSQLAEEKAVGLTADDSIAFRSALDEVDAKREAEGSNLSKSDVYEILDSMDLTDAQRAYLYGNLNYSEVSNIYYTSSDLNGWIAEKRSEGKSDGDIASPITKTYKALYLEYWRKHDTSGMREIKQKLMALNLRKKDKPYYTEDTFNKWLND